MTLQISDLIGTAAAFCSMSSFVPQLAKIWRERDASQISLRMYLVTVTGFILWTAFGALTKSWPIVGSNLVCLMLSAAILVLRLRFGDGPKAAGKS
ncbi:SemiSWEET family sugar transporter [Phenylobacterium immobile]|uniref:SemiSWEET family sugar transporter n=1 Tax=Phenylobacterium immobile TaxID=21 RepID=UPI000AD1A878|nr:SemiSWEET transporter [Phenylobacterium immobile]